jgi:hypothetical protein
MSSDWGSDYGGFGPKKRKPPMRDRAGRALPTNPSDDKPMRRFRDNIDIDKLQLFMSENDKYKYFLEDLYNPEYARYTFATICRKWHVTLHELQSIYTDGMRHMALLNAATSTPDIMADVAEDALSKLVVCPRCDGIKSISEPVRNDEGKIISESVRECPQCKGVGEVRQKGDDHSRDLVFESMKLTGQKGPLVAIQQNFGRGDGLDAKMEAMLKLTQQVAMGGGAKNIGEVDNA